MYLDTLASDAIKKSPKNTDLSVNLFWVEVTPMYQTKIESKRETIY